MKNKVSLGYQLIMWTARILGLLLILLTLFFAIGEGVSEHRPNAVPTPIINYLVGALMLGGLGLAWKWEFTGALISLIGFAGVIIVNPYSLTHPMMFLFAVPSILFLMHWWMSKSERPIEKKSNKLT
jgi:hypothetical protein